MLPADHKIMVFAVCCLAAGPASAARNRTHFLDYGPSAASSGMGESAVAYGMDVGAIYYNPALMYSIRDQVGASHWFLFDGARYDFIGVVINGESSAFGIGGTQFYRDNIEARQTITDPGTPVHNDQMAAYGSYGGRLARLRLNYGVSLKWLRYDMAGFAANGFAADLGLTRSLFTRTYSMGKKIVISGGMSASNIWQTGILMDTAKEYAPMTVRSGISLLTTLWPKYNREANTLTYDKLRWELGSRVEDGSAELNTGIQYTANDRYILRAGYARGVTIGCGLAYGDITFDYAFMMKDLANFHRIGFAYRFGQAEPTEMTMPITDDFQKIYQQALRVYERFVRNAEELMKQERHEDARLVLLKAIPLNPRANGSARDLLKVCEQVLLSKRTGLLTVRANDAVASDDMQSAFGAYMEVYALTADPGVLGLAHEIIKKAPTLAEKEQAFINDHTKTMNDNLDTNDFSSAEKQLAVLRPLVDPETGAQLSSTLSGRKGLWVDKLLAEAMSRMQKSDYPGAYSYFGEAYRLSGDAGIRDQMTISSDKYLSGRKFGVEDNIYADKLYYRMAYNLATDSPYEPVRGELNTFNPFYDQTDFKASLVALGKEAPEAFPVK